MDEAVNQTEWEKKGMDNDESEVKVAAKGGYAAKKEEDEGQAA